MDTAAVLQAVEGIRRAIVSRRFLFNNEKALHGLIAAAFALDGIDFEREVRLAPGDVVDFVVGPVAVEVKIDGPLAALTRQLDRYAQHDLVQALVVVSSRKRLANLPQILRGKEVTVVELPLSLGGFW